MRGVWEIFAGDMRSLAANVICAIVAMGLVLVPPMYAWITSLGFWDPYDNTGGLSVAVANEDEGFSGGLLDMRVDAGAQVVAKIHENDQFHWVFVDKDAAVAGVESGEYYAAVVIPADFSADLMSVTRADPSKASIDYYCNEKENAIAPHVTSQGATELQVQIGEAFNETVADVVLGVGGDASDYLSGEGVRSFAEQSISQLDDVVEMLRRTQAELRAVGTLVVGVDELADDAGSLLDKLAGECRDVAELARQAQADLTDDEARQRYEDALAALPEELRADFPSAQELAGGIDADGARLEELVSQVERAAESMASTADTLGGELGGIGSSLDETAAILGGAADSLAETRDELRAALDSSDMAEVRKIVGDDPSALASFLSSPTELVEHPVYKVDDNGSSMSPFYTSLSLWVGALFLVALTSAEPSRRRLAQLKGPSPTPAQAFLGHYGVFAVIAMAQALVVCFGNVFFVGVQCGDLWAYLLAGLVAALSFSMLAYTLTVSFGPIGKAVMVVGLVLQIGGAGGIFPVELSAPLFQDVYPWLPITHSMAAFEGAMFGAYGDQYWMALACLGLVFAGSLVVGLVLWRPIRRLNDYVVRKLAETEVL